MYVSINSVSCAAALCAPVSARLHGAGYTERAPGRGRERESSRAVMCIYNLVGVSLEKIIFQLVYLKGPKNNEI